MDARTLTFEDDSFDCVIDKGTCDAMLCDTATGTDNVYKIVVEASRILRSDRPATIVLISHIKVHTQEFEDAFEGCIIPALGQKKTVRWHIKAHTASELATVYVIESHPKRFTRSSVGKDGDGRTVSMEVLSYSDDEDDEEEEEEEEEEELCGECN